MDYTLWDNPFFLRAFSKVIFDHTAVKRLLDQNKKNISSCTPPTFNLYIFILHIVNCI